MAHETLVCQENISGDTLSALRDETLPGAEVTRLRAHIPTCAACQARQADFEKMAAALRAQRELDPGDRILAGVQARIAGRSQASGSRGGRLIWNLRGVTGGRRIWAGLAALAPVAAIILLFVYVFAGIGQHPTPAATPTLLAPTPTPTFFKKIYPTQTPALVQVPTMTPAVSAEAAWGPAFTPTYSHTFVPSGSVVFIPGAYSPDLTTIGGILYDSQADKSQLAYYTAASGAITRLTPTWRGYAGPWGGASGIDSRYITYGFNSQPGATCGVCNNTLWSLDRATGKTWEFNAGEGGDLFDYTSGDHVAYEPGTSQILVADLAAHTVKVAAPIGAKLATPTTPLGPDERMLGFQWPYLMYAETPPATPPAQQPTTSLNILNLATGAHTVIASGLHGQGGAPVDPDEVGMMALVGNTLYAQVDTQLNGVDSQGKPVNLIYGTLYRLDNAFTTGASAGASAGKFIAVAYWPVDDSGISTPMAASKHLVWLGSGYIWDNAESRLVKTTLNNAQIVGPYLVSIVGEQPGAWLQTYHVVAYDTTKLPMPPGFP